MHRSAESIGNVNKKIEYNNVRNRKNGKIREKQIMLYACRTDIEKNLRKVMPTSILDVYSFLLKSVYQMWVMLKNLTFPY